MITEEQYKEAKKIVEQYEQQLNILDVSNQMPEIKAVPCECGKNFNPYMDGGSCWNCDTGICC